jgi:DUF1009 family protein
MAGCLTRTRPSEKASADVAIAFEAARAIGRIDAGQAAVAVDGLVVALEALEGTDAMLDRVRQLRERRRVSWRGRAGVLAKCAKPQQDLRIDMPTIGPATVEAAAAVGLAGIAVEAGRVMIVSREETVQAADRHGMFIVAEEPEGGSRPA